VRVRALAQEEVKQLNVSPESCIQKHTPALLHSGQIEGGVQLLHKEGKMVTSEGEIAKSNSVLPPRIKFIDFQAEITHQISEIVSIQEQFTCFSFSVEEELVDKR
jgi:hypothetical protein